MCLGMQEIIGTQGKAESEASSWVEMLPALVNYYGGQRYGTVECWERLYADDSAGKASSQSHGERGLHECAFCARYSDCTAPMDEEQ